MILLLPAAFALTLDEAVRRAAEVDPNALIADADTKIGRLDAGEAFASLTVTPGLSASRTWGPADGETWTLSADVGALDVGNWFDAFQKQADARSLGHTADATRLDAQYYAAELYMTVVAAESALTAARHGEEVALATAKATDARVAAGIESELLGRSARIGVLQAQAATETAQAELDVARVVLARALEVDAAGLTVEAPGPVSIGDLDPKNAPTVLAAKESWEAAKLGHGQRIAEFFPTGSLSASSALDPMAWSITTGFTWRFDGIVGPVLRERKAALEQTIAWIGYDAAVKDAEAGVAASLARAKALTKVAEVARAREELAEEALKVGQARLTAGVASTLEVLRLQDEATRARTDRVQAQLDAATAALEARRVAGVGW